MLKLIDKLEKSKTFWSLLWISLGFFFLRLPSLFEPNWYGDEGYYQVIGMALNNGRMLYSQIWDNKPPLLYLTYALFQGDQFGARFASLLFGLFALWLFFLLTKKLFNKTSISIITTSLFALLFGIPLLEGNIANAENFMLLPIVASALLIYKFSELEKMKKIHRFLFNPQSIILGAAGFLLGIALLFKIVALFDFAAFLMFLLILSLPEKNLLSVKTTKNLVIYLFHDLICFIVGFLIPLIVTVFYFVINHAFNEFIQATFFGNINYVNYGNQQVVSHGFLIMKLIALALVVLILIWKRNVINKPTLLTFLWVAFSLFNAFFSQRPYTHYVLVVLPSFCLFIGLILYEHRMRLKQVFLALFLVTLILLMTSFNIYSLKKTVLYYQNAFLFITGKKDIQSYQAFFDGKTPRDYEIAAFLKMHTKPNDPVFIWGDSPQIYVLSKTLPINQYPVAYHITESKERVLATQHALDTIKPKYIVILFESPNLPFRLTEYNNKFTLKGAAIYERSF